MSDTHILVLGAGSVGKRHLRNFSGLGCRVSAMDVRQDRIKEAAGEVTLAETFDSLESAVAKASDFSGVVVGSPTKFHVEQAAAFLNKGVPVLLEKPMSMDGASAAKLVEVAKQTKVPLLLGYTYRWWPPLQEFRKRLQAGEIGKVLYVRCTMSAHLADWHPWEDYRSFFMASRELGGGALLDESHILDLIVWSLGMPAEVFSRIERLSNLEIETDDNVEALFFYEKGTRVSIHLDLYARPHERSIIAIGEKGTLKWTYDPNRIQFGNGPAKEWKETQFSCERNEMFLGVAREFMEVIISGKRPSCTVDDGYQVMRLIDAMRDSSISGRAVTVVKR
ncbi:MAG TPA: Gfo/Idh/MocA family oxidoreductase [Methanocella sp.]|nr:Gfo/Idh/MocA family oxidoreductase [Methanocella sp.]